MYAFLSPFLAIWDSNNQFIPQYIVGLTSTMDYRLINEQRKMEFVFLRQGFDWPLSTFSILRVE